MTPAQLAILQRDADTGMEFGYHLSQTQGRWCIAPRLTARLRDSGYAVALTQKRYTELRHAWERERYGATLDGIEAAGPQMLAALVAAEGFIAGFDGDELQPGVAELLATLREALAAAQA